MRRRVQRAGLVVLLVAGLGATTQRARFDVGGYGLLGNRELLRTVRLLHPGQKAPASYDANFIEDAALVVLARLNRDGYLEPRLHVEVTRTDGSTITRTWDQSLEPLLPRPLAAQHVVFRIERRVLSYYESLEFIGLEHLTPARARSFFVETDAPIQTRSTRVFTPARLKQSLANLTETLARQGFADAQAEAVEIDHNKQTGAVRVQVAVAAGRRHIVESVVTEVYGPGETEPRQTSTVRPNARYSRFWHQDFVRQMVAEQYRAGYPDATGTAETVKQIEGDEQVRLHLRVRVETGPFVRLGEVRFAGNEHTRESVLRQQVTLEPGEPLNPIEVENSRYRLGRLGIFDAINDRQIPVEPGTRDVLFEVDEGRQLELSLLAGYGSYDQLRAGFDLEQHNVFGLAHQSRLRASQSFRTTRGDYIYALPTLFGLDMTTFLNARALRREEPSFTRQEYEASLGVQRHFPSTSTDLGARYSYQFLNAMEVPQALTGFVDRAQVAALVFDLKHDRRDNPLAPEQGYDVFSTLELASAALGGEVEYQRVELGTTFHWRLGGGRVLHAGVRHGFVTTVGGDRADLPFNKRFFPGGENSVRGFSEGEAGPRTPGGTLIGAETYTRGNLELEQFLTTTISLVVFIDVVGFAADINDYPIQQAVYSVGGGARWRTLVGPVRLEYGYNPKRRARDPVGTLHFSIGFPF